MSFLAFFFIVVSLVSFVAAQLILKRAMEATTSTGFRNAQFVSKVIGWRYSDDDLVLSHTRIAAAIRPELSLSIPGFERDLHHADGSGRAKRKAKRATHHWRIANQRRNRARFTQLAI